MFSVGKVWKCSRVGAVRKYHGCYAHCVLPEAPPLLILRHNNTQYNNEEEEEEGCLLGECENEKYNINNNNGK